MDPPVSSVFPLIFLLCLTSFPLLSTGIQFKQEKKLFGTKLSRVVLFENQSLSLESVVSQSLTEARKNAQLMREVKERNDEGRLKLDLLVAGDHSLFEAFWEMQGSTRENAHFSVKYYLEAVFEQVKSIYEKQVFFGKHQIKLRLAGVLVIEEERDCPLKASAFFHGVNGTDDGNGDTRLTWSIDALKAISALSSWRALHTDVLPKNDHIVFVTKFDLLSPSGSASTQGMGFVQKMCDSHESISVVEDIGALTTSAIAAHEIGHNLGAFHDGEGDNACDPRFNFLMSPSASSSTSGVVFQNGFRFSRCSLDAIEGFLSTVESSCLTAEPMKEMGKRALLVRSSSSPEKRKLKPGEQFGLSRQCQIAFAPHYGECNQKQYQDLNPDPCRRLWCKNRLEHRFAPCETKSYLPLMDGSECGVGRWCQSGSCVINKYHDPDLECQDLNDVYCREKYPPAVMKVFCVRKSFSAICCRQCKKYNHYMYDKYRLAEALKTKKIPPRKLKILDEIEHGLNSTDID